MRPDDHDPWLSELKRRYQPDTLTQSESFKVGIHRKIQRHRLRRQGVMVGVIFGLMATGLYWVHEGTDADRLAIERERPIAQVGPQPMTPSTVEFVQMPMGEAASPKASDDRSFDFISGIDDELDASERDWRALDESLGEEYLAFTQMIDMTDI